MVVRKLILLAALVVGLALASPVWAGTLTFDGTNLPNGQGLLNFAPGVGHTLTIGSGNGGLGALITEMVSSPSICGAGNCAVTGGYSTLVTGAETSGVHGGGSFAYTFGGGGTFSIIGGIAGLGIANGSTLLTLSFLPGMTFSGFGNVGVISGNVNLSSIVLNPLLNAALANHLFIGGSVFLETISLNAACQNGGNCFGPLQIASANLQFIPEPATLSVLGVGLFAFGAGLRRKVAAN